MTEQEQKAIKWMKNVRDDAVVKQETKEHDLITALTAVQRWMK